MKRSPIKMAMVVLAYLAAGAVINVGVTLALVLVLGAAKWEGTSSYGYGAKAAEVDWVIKVPPHWPPHPTQRGRNSRSWYVSIQQEAEFPVHEVGPDGQPTRLSWDRFVKNGTIYRLIVRRWGWPCYSLQLIWPEEVSMRTRTISVDPAGTTSWATGFRISSAGVPSKDAIHLPLLPVWPGFVVNGLLYATVVGIALFVTRALRRGLRLRRGLCPGCAYPIGLSANCTECGHVLPSRMIQVRMPEGAAAPPSPSGTSPAQTEKGAA